MRRALAVLVALAACAPSSPARSPHGAECRFDPVGSARVVWQRCFPVSNAHVSDVAIRPDGFTLDAEIEGPHREVLGDPDGLVDGDAPLHRGAFTLRFDASGAYVSRRGFVPERPDATVMAAMGDAVVAAPPPSPGFVVDEDGHAYGAVVDGDRWAVVAVDRDGNLAWRVATPVRTGGPLLRLHAMPHGVAVAATDCPGGPIVLAHQVVAYDARGATRFQRCFAEGISVVDVAGDRAGRTYVAGGDVGEHRGGDAVVIVLDPSGAPIATEHFGYPDRERLGVAQAVAVVGAEVVVAGTSTVVGKANETLWLARLAF